MPDLAISAVLAALCVLVFRWALIRCASFAPRRARQAVAAVFFLTVALGTPLSLLRSRAPAAVVDALAAERLDRRARLAACRSLQGFDARVECRLEALVLPGFGPRPPRDALEIIDPWRGGGPRDPDSRRRRAAP